MNIHVIKRTLYLDTILKILTLLDKLTLAILVLCFGLVMLGLL